MPLQTDQDDVRARRLVRQLCKDAGFSLVDQTKLVTAASELARNARIHGGGGVLRWQVLTEEKRVGIRLVFQDQGRGIPDLALAMQDGWSSGDGLGLGLSGAKRLVSEFDLQTEVGKGTTVTIVRWR
jgi:serine/threonine-protein kinase RsbT